MSSLKTYSAKEVAIAFGDISIDSGFNDGEFCRIEFKADMFSLKIGADGQGHRSATNNNSATITLTVMQDANAHLLLSAWANAARQDPHKTSPLTIKLINNGKSYIAEKAWISKQATDSFAAEVSSREWTIETHELIRPEEG